MKRLKAMSRSEFGKFNRDWQPIRLIGEAVPELFHDISDDDSWSFVVSGQNQCESYPYSNERIQGNQVGGMNTYRRNTDSRAPYKMYWYRIIDSGGEQLIVAGPFKKKGPKGHFLDRFPEEFMRIEVVGSSKKEEL